MSDLRDVNIGFTPNRIPDLELPGSHPKRAFMRRLVDLEVRLAYFDRVKDSLPAPMQKSDAGVLAKEPPEAVWPYADSGE